MIGDYHKQQFKNEEYAPINKPLRHILDNLNPNASILDFGCGNGNFLLSFRRELPHAYLCGVDPYLPEGCLAKDLTSCSLICSSIFDLKNALTINQKFDFINCTAVFEHMSKEECLTAIQIFKQRLKPNGYIYLETPNSRNILTPDFTENNFYSDPTHIRPWNESTYRILGDMYNLRVLGTGKSRFFKSIIATPYLWLKYWVAGDKKAIESWFRNFFGTSSYVIYKKEINHEVYDLRKRSKTRSKK